eukprot:scaffold632371_cov22-Prasinocladus_malaysianus.AAC.1
MIAPVLSNGHADNRIAAIDIETIDTIFPDLQNIHRATMIIVLPCRHHCIFPDDTNEARDLKMWQMCRRYDRAV